MWHWAESSKSTISKELHGLIECERMRHVVCEEWRRVEEAVLVVECEDCCEGERKGEERLKIQSGVTVNVGYQSGCQDNAVLSRFLEVFRWPVSTNDQRLHTVHSKQPSCSQKLHLYELSKWIFIWTCESGVKINSCSVVTAWGCCFDRVY